MMSLIVYRHEPEMCDYMSKKMHAAKLFKKVGP